MKCPPLVAKSLKPDASSTSASASSPSDLQSSCPVAKVVLAIVPLNSNDDSSSPQVIENDNGAHMRPMPGMIGFVAPGPSEKKKMPTKGSDMKRTRRDRGEMEDIMFKLFERQPNWMLRQLIQETDQPEQFLKDILKELCVYNKGANQGTYELKPEYRKSVGEPTPE